MPELLDDLFDAVSTDVASRTRPPGAPRAIARSRRRRQVASVAAVTAVLIGAVSWPLLAGDRSSVDPAPPPATPTPSPGLDVGEVAVWYDEAGLHRGDVVEQTAVPLPAKDQLGRLTLVRTGALYLDNARDEVWFHPWGGEPRIVGRDAEHGPVGDPQGDLAAWFEGSDLVVLDTTSARELVRVSTPSGPDRGSQEHLYGGDGLMQVSPEAVVWRGRADTAEVVMRFDLRTMEITWLTAGRDPASWARGSSGRLTDVHDETQLWSWGLADLSGGLSVTAGGDEMELPAFEATTGRLSPDGRFLLAVTGHPHGAELVDLGSGRTFTAPEPPEGTNVWLAWSYGASALVLNQGDAQDGEGKLYTCDADQRRCNPVPTSGGVVLPS